MKMGRIMKSRFLVLPIVFGLLSAVQVKAQTETIVVGEPGHSNNQIPFSKLGPSRYQQVYDSSAFGPITLRIFSLAFRHCVGAHDI